MPPIVGAAEIISRTYPDLRCILPLASTVDEEIVRPYLKDVKVDVAVCSADTKQVLAACDLALNIFDPIKHMEHALPIREWDRNGYQRFLKDYRKNMTAESAMFELPADYERYSIGDVLAGLVEGKKADGKKVDEKKVDGK